MWRRARNTLRQYRAGVEKLGAELWEVWQLKKTQADLTWHQRMLLRATPRDALRVLPIVVNPVPPPFGLLIPLLAAAFPQRLLTRQFWTDEQLLKFIAEDFDRRWRGPLDSLGDALQESVPDTATWPETMARELFHEANIFDLQALRMRNSHHLRALAQAWCGSTWMPMAWMTDRYLEERLRKSAEWVLEDDALLRKENLDKLSQHELVVACFDRGLDVRRVPPRRAIEEWFDWVYDGTEPKPAPSLVLHAPCLITLERRDHDALVP